MRSLRELKADVGLRFRILWGKSVRLIARPPFPEHPDGARYVHLGCGLIAHPAFVNVDAIPRPHVHFVSGIARLPMFADDSVDMIYASHCLEHLSYRNTPAVLKEWHRVLKPGGLLRVSVPDFDCLIDIYEAAGNNMGSIIEQIYGGHEDPYNIHMTIFNRAELERILIATGFENCRLWSPGSDELSKINDFSSYEKKIADRTYPVSLNLEATKRHAV